MINRISLSTLFLFLSTIISAQSAHCGTEQMLSIWATQNDEIFNRLQQVRDSLTKLILQNDSSPQTRTEITIPIVIHVVHHPQDRYISDELIWEQVANLNKDFNGKNEDLDLVPAIFQAYIGYGDITFCLASETPNGEPTNGIKRVTTSIDRIGVNDALFHTARTGSNAWDTEHYLNIWIADTGPIITGYGAFPNQVEPEKDGVVIHPSFFGKNNSARYNLGRVLVHEIGHYLGLDHIWGTDRDCSSDDGLEDTPPQQKEYFGCPSFPQSSCNSHDMFMNFMDYVDDDCMVLFTPQQQQRMRYTIQNFRPGLTDHLQCLPSTPSEKIPSFEVYPNPSTGPIRIHFSQQVSQVASINIYTLSGQLVHSKNSLLYSDMMLDFSSLSPGIYLLKIGKQTSSKFLLL